MQPPQKARILYIHIPTSLTQQDSYTEIPFAVLKSTFEIIKQQISKHNKSFCHDQYTCTSINEQFNLPFDFQ
jgi:hypothetical protein